VKRSSTGLSAVTLVAVVLTMLAVVLGDIHVVGAQDTTSENQHEPVAGQDTPTNEGRVGRAVVAQGGDVAHTLSEGGSTTQFALKLPEGAACPGDSANDNWRIQSFIIPEADDPGTLTYQSTKPTGDGRWALYGLDTRSYINHLTAVSGPGEPGVIDEQPSFTFSLFPPGTLPDGVYRIGIACTQWNQTYRFWDTRIEITNTADDQPAQLRWTALEVGSGSATSSSANGLVWLLLAALAVGGVVVGLYLFTRRRPRSASTVSPKETR
jgi:hypothetical protein